MYPQMQGGGLPSGPTQSPQEALASLFGVGPGPGGDPSQGAMPGMPGMAGMGGPMGGGMGGMDAAACQPADASGLLQMLGQQDPGELLALQSILSGGGMGAAPMGQSYPPPPADALGTGPAMSADSMMGIPGLGAAAQMPPGQIPPPPGLLAMLQQQPGAMPPGMIPGMTPPGMPGQPPMGQPPMMGGMR